MLGLSHPRSAVADAASVGSQTPTQAASATAGPTVADAASVGSQTPTQAASATAGPTVADAASVGSQTPTQAASATAGLPSQTTPASFQASAQPLTSAPIAFELNQGQAPAQYTFDSRGPGYNLLLSPNSGGSWWFDYSGTTLPDATYTFTALTESDSLTSPLSATQLVTIDTTAPSVLVTVPVTTSLTPVVDVQASDLVGIPANATVTLDVDLNNDGNFTDTGETGYTSGTLVNGFVAIPVALTATGTYRVRARVTDTAGNEGTSNVATFTIGTVSNPWTLTDAVVRTSATVDGNPDLQLGDLQVSHPLDLDHRPEQPYCDVHV